MSEKDDSGPTPYLRIENVGKSFGSFRALEQISFGIHDGEFVCFLGPSGCGKTTLLRCIAGLEFQTDGSIYQGGVDISWLPPSKRDFGIVFQSYALFPNLTVTDNVAYGLINKKLAKTDIEKRVTDLLNLVDLIQHSGKYPSQLSGGEQQRVALVRALATSPGLLLLDEPLSALDAKVRAHLRREIRDLQKRLGVTTIMVTHDQEEAQTMADRIFVMSHGRLEQVGTPNEIYDQPASPFVADFIGVMNFISVIVTGKSSIRCEMLSLDCETDDFAVDTRLKGAIRPEDIVVLNSVEVGDNVVETVIQDVEHLGSYVRLYLCCTEMGDCELRADVTKSAARRLVLVPGQQARVRIPPESIRLYRDDG
ncbi:MAG: putative 2-aminoethylphosphonate ABC transporter ATP-binding protein [Arenicellales bacterium]|jgi:iron(III) transport system ATP-binding protein|nr:putative 2-aminoethylphosphonate ABC transporter ATP-binding protein [Acidiferrobacteraceae bacterium]MDP7523206.1 putative 2-aminoethylphosphonate ABC transporter ATP-binding protein [Arenicellales bacterium]